MGKPSAKRGSEMRSVPHIRTFPLGTVTKTVGNMQMGGTDPFPFLRTALFPALMIDFQAALWYDRAMRSEPQNRHPLTRVARSAHRAHRGHCLAVQFLRLRHWLCVLIGVLALSSSAWAQFNAVEPALPGSVEYWLTTNHFTWVQTSAPITVGCYVEDLISDIRWDQPVGRGRVGIVTATGWDADYNCMAATVDFWRDYSVGLVFPEVSAIQIVPVPEPSTLRMLLPGAVLAYAALRRRRRAQADS
jgi:hypothetical protein